MVRRCLLVAILVVIACKKKSSTQSTGTGTGSAPGSAAPTQKFVAEWNVIAANGVCSANEHGSCPPDTECTPPPPRAIECPPGSAEGIVRVGQLEDATCVIAGTSTKTPCPLPKGEAIAPTS